MPEVRGQSDDDDDLSELDLELVECSEDRVHGAISQVRQELIASDGGAMYRHIVNRYLVNADLQTSQQWMLLISTGLTRDQLMRLIAYIGSSINKDPAYAHMGTAFAQSFINGMRKKLEV